MQELNNIDVIILFVIIISGLIALSRGLVKEVLSIIGWVLGTLAVIYLLPLISPLIEEYISGGIFGNSIAALCILIIFMIIWNLSTSGIINDIRVSKLSAVDRLLGLFFGIARAFLLVVLVYIFISWIIPHDKQPQSLQDSKYFTLAGKFAKPIEELIPEETLEHIREKASSIHEEDKKEEGEDKEKRTETKKKEQDPTEALFDKLTQPQIKKLKKDLKDLQKLDKEVDEGYNKLERDNLDRLIDNIH